jgi:Amt family ammonium transporter
MTLNSGDTAWMLISTVLVLFMTLPGLALFYGGLVRSKNVLSVLMQTFAITSGVSVLWLIFAYGLSFADGGTANPFSGGFHKIFLSGVGLKSVNGTIPETVYFMFQMTFAIITPALIVGAYPERMKFQAVFLFSMLWLIAVYTPVAHWVWGGGWLAELGVKDFAGGLVVHLNAGVAALVVAAVLGRRKGHPQDLAAPHNPGMTMAGACMLWVGWFGFNAGSALSAGGNAGMAMVVTHISASLAALTWMTVQWCHRGKPTLVGIVSGGIAGLAAITPASGYVGPYGALTIGVGAGVACYFGAEIVKRFIKVDDSLDVFGVHGVGGALGVLLVSFFASTSLGGLGQDVSVWHQLWVQLVGISAVAIWSGTLSFVIVKLVTAFVGLRVSDMHEEHGLDLSQHGETAYKL